MIKFPVVREGIQLNPYSEVPNPPMQTAHAICLTLHRAFPPVETIC